MSRPVQTVSGNLPHHALNHAHAWVAIMVADTVPCQNVLSMPERFPIFLPNLHRSKNFYWKSNRQLSLGFIGS